MVRDLRGVIEREKADAGLFITIGADQTHAGGSRESRSVRESALQQASPAMQIKTVEALLKGSKPDLRPLAIEAGFRRAEKEDMTELDYGNLPIVMLNELSPGKERQGATPTA